MKEWDPVSRRGQNHNLLVLDIVMKALKSNWTGMMLGAEKEFIPDYRELEGARWLGSKDILEYTALLRKACDEERILDYGFKQEEMVVHARDYAINNSKADYSAYSNSSLDKEFLALAEVLARLWSQPYHYILMDRFLPGLIDEELAKGEKDVGRRAAMLLTLITSDRINEIGRESIELAELAEKLLKADLAADSPKAEGLIFEHLKKYAYLGRYYFRSKAYDRKAIIERLMRLTPQEIQRTKEEFRRRTSVAQESRKIITSLGLDEHTKYLIKTAKQYAYCSNLCDENFNFSVHAFEPLLNEIAKRLSLTWDELTSMRVDEISQSLLKGGPVNVKYKRELDERFNDHAIVFKDGIVTVLHGKELQEYKSKELELVAKVDRLTELKGLGASPGLARGRARIVFNTRELGKVKPGEVLVTAMTTPEFVPAMQRASAIVTDDGGVLCHAAIVSRELGVPCLVGTKVATKAIKDGDLIEVDATRGLVRMITRS